MEQAEKALAAMDDGTMDVESIAAWEQELAAIEQALLGETNAAIDSENYGYASLDDVLAAEIAEAADA